uniref:glutaminase n=1 Tax=Chromera velia CCMP2878 TaxID=1169474 RepID=A0A0G4HCG2_9ALVE|mmetsp:Transcript_19875/g.39976  ORF Transcript_19875/g.39976 Transcript_19875/m.39976 type:complete len:343 (+) Transcript_19875:114-1142(+)|eukprot:Cvel_6313.t1-p1 / transcript=Cvel_6313.t1 / gene=Cvel_6313 / organism=Chromera_velia_CCMP2878 / gene_product=Pyridoxal biosynthesis protein PDX2, putative / transcript_product=Pyridoxal biosynthesis protein PDX2, putative / location=Cvel_scaffold306:52659-55162(-) / protein_length=342 / sequence_SO=supercontig / SO=protein_coding / is_pseudo=false
MDGEGKAMRLGVLALQGAFEEHKKMVEALKFPSLEVVQVRTKEELGVCDALIIPGGESTTMRIIAQADELFLSLRQFALEEKKPVWGTCAGSILLSEHITSTSSGGKCLGSAEIAKLLLEAEEERERAAALSLCGKKEKTTDAYGEFVGGVDVITSRNFFGRQIASFECPIHPCGELAESEAAKSFKAVCIRAPAILATLSDEVEVLARLPLVPSQPAPPIQTSQLTEPHSPSSVTTTSAADEKAQGAGTGTPATPPRSLPPSPAPSQKAPETAPTLCAPPVEDVQSAKRGVGLASFREQEVIAAVAQGNILMTIFHPELTDDPFFHRYFVERFLGLKAEKA